MSDPGTAPADGPIDRPRDEADEPDEPVEEAAGTGDPGVPLLDLTAQYDAIRDEVDDAVRRVVESQYFVLGPEVEAFEAEIAELVGVPHGVGVASGTDALLLPLRALDPEPGDEVIVPAFTFFATAGAVWNAGFRPVFCDVDPENFNVTRETVEAAWTERTRAVIPVHLFGQMAPVEEIVALARERGAFVLEDAAQAIGAAREIDGEWRQAGSVGDAGAFSFFPTKNLGSFGEGGMVTTADAGLGEKVAKLRVHGGRQMYHHEMVGTNSRLDALQAAVILAKLPHLDGWNDERRENAARYDALLDGQEDVVRPRTLDHNRHVFNQYTIRVPDRDRVRERMGDAGIGTGVYYPVPLHLQACFAELGYSAGDLRESERAASEVLSLPIFPELAEEQQRFVIDTLTE